MEIDIRVGSESLTITIENPYHFDLPGVAKKVSDFGAKLGHDIKELDIEKLIPRMIKGVAGCEGGCPSDAKSLVREGFINYDLSYIDGGIIKATRQLKNNTSFEIKVFPEF